jgi:hypothetical protein
MSHRAALYEVKVRPHRKADDWQLLGDYDHAATWLGGSIAADLTSLNGEGSGGNVKAQFEAALPNLWSDEVGASILSGRKGVRSVLRRRSDPPFARTPDHFEDMRSAVLFSLPRNDVAGRLAVHVPHGHSCKSILEVHLRRSMADRGFFLKLAPIVSQDALLEAVERGAIERVTLIKQDPTSSDKFRDAAQWGSDEIDRLELTIPSKRDVWLRRDPLKKFLDDRSEENLRQIIEFEGLIFDEVAVTVELPDGAHRTYYLEHREGGHPMTIGLDLMDADELGAGPEHLTAELRKAASTVSGAA